MKSKETNDNERQERGERKRKRRPFGPEMNAAGVFHYRSCGCVIVGSERVVQVRTRERGGCC
jgi:hypothetical protein